MFKVDQDEHEHDMIGSFLTERARPFIRYWSEAVDAVEDGGTLTISGSDIPPWCDDE